MEVLYDEKHDILYIDLVPDMKAKESKPLDDDIFIDIGEDGEIIGIEI
ncbi:MAG: DUF2283 domain-containing protein [Desulfurococcales archaeon]|jgi:uncharacterized protein YuzE|nr:DUF2283 domain-containing protein [Desulfurococcales archaeon]